MKLATYLKEDQPTVGAVVEEQIYDLAACLTGSGQGNATLASCMLNFLSAGEAALTSARAALTWAQTEGDGTLAQPLTTTELLAPIPCPGKLLCLAGNYASHIQEGGGTYIGKEKMIPRFFSKPCTAIIGTNGTVRIPPSVAWADWELELAVVIGAAGRDIAVADAEAHIGGYTVFNDISGRELAFRTQLPLQDGDWFFDWQVGKWLDTFGPMGPWLTTADEVPHPDRLSMKLWHNDTLHQDASTGQMIFSPAEAIAFISQFITLEPGDVIATGTPAGVGLSKKIKLQPGDHIKGEIEGLGVLQNSVAAL